MKQLATPLTIGESKRPGPPSASWALWVNRSHMIIPLNIAPDTTTVVGYADDAVRNMEKIYGFHLDYSVASLARRSWNATHLAAMQSAAARD